VTPMSRMKKNNIEAISKSILDNFDKVATALGIDYEEYGNRLTMACPVHGGDNESACVIYKDGASIIGNWSCFTHSCEEKFGISIIGFIRGALETKTGKEQSYRDVNKFIEKVLRCKMGEIQPELSGDTYDLCKFADYFTKDRETSIIIPKRAITTGLKIPSQYYVKRGYSKETLTKYSVGFCNTKGKPFYLRTVVPVFDDTGNNAVGFVARTINGECPDCGWHHYKEYRCPQTKVEKYFASKWINSKGFSKSQHLYNVWNAADYLRESKTAILVEGVGDVWRLEECGIKNSLAIFGCKLSENQVEKLYEFGVIRLIVALDNDGPGLEGKEKISLNYGRYFDLEFITTENKDIGDSSCEEIYRLFNGRANFSYCGEKAERQVEHHEEPIWS
jgi:5S rRNA maturation endonuclease (ribonuclease M5)